MARVFAYLAVALSIVLAVLFAVPTLRSEVVTTVTTATTVVPAPYVNPSYITPPPAEVISCSVSLNGALANVNATAYAFESGYYDYGLLTSYQGSLNQECWSPMVYAGQGPFQLSVSQCQLPSSYDHVSLPLIYASSTLGFRVQSIDVYGFNQYCAMVVTGPQVLNVTVVRNSGVSGYEIIVYVGSPSTSDTVSLSIYYNGILVYQVYKYIQLPSQWVSPCGVMSVDFGPIQPLACGTYTITATASAPGYPQSQYTTTLNPCSPATTAPITINVSAGFGVVPVGAKLVVTVEEPGYGTVFSGLFTVPPSGVVTTPAVLIGAAGVYVNVTTIEWMGVPIGTYSTMLYYLTTSNATTPLTYIVPAGELNVTTALRPPPTEQSSVTIYYGTAQVATGSLPSVFVLPVNSPMGTSYTIDVSMHGMPESLTAVVMAGAVQSLTAPAGALSISFPGGYVPSNYTLSLTYSGMTVASGSASAVSIVLPPGVYSLSGVVDGVPLQAMTVTVVNGETITVSIPVGKVTVNFANGLTPSNYTLALEYNGEVIASGSASDVSIVVPAGTYTLVGNVSGVPISPISLSVSAGTQASATVPVSQLSITAYTASGAPLSNAEITVSYNGKEIATGIGSLSIVVLGGVPYTVVVSAYGVTNTTTVTPAVGSVTTIKITIPTTSTTTTTTTSTSTTSVTTITVISTITVIMTKTVSNHAVSNLMQASLIVLSIAAILLAAIALTQAKRR
jgi:hypothetical protein